LTDADFRGATFSSRPDFGLIIRQPDDAANALVSAVKADDIKALIKVLGPDGEDIVSSGNSVADAATREK
jgi:Protein of unknown function (DUF2950)